jgi:amidohydrolase
VIESAHPAHPASHIVDGDEMESITAVRDEAEHLAPSLRALRRDLHAHPELGLELPRTQARVVEELKELDLELGEGTACTSVVAVLRGGAPVEGRRPAVLLRGDMDAVPVTEETGLEFASTAEGAMHACGHDLHTAMLVGAARLLAAHREELVPDVVLMFQPGEEGWEGARAMIDEGVLDAAGPRVEAAYALHVFSTLEPGVHLRPGAMMASSSSLDVTVHGRGGHASAPQLARDPVPVAAEIVLALQTLVTRRVDVFDPAVLTVGVLEAGTRRNVIPATARLEATVRTFSDDAAELVGHEALRLVRGIADAHGVEVDAEFTRARPVTANDPGCTAYAEEVVRDLLGPERLHRLPHPFTGAEDFSRVLGEVPGAFLALGALPPGADPASAPYNHSSLAVFDDAVLPEGAAVLAALALRHGRRGYPTHEEDA